MQEYFKAKGINSSRLSRFNAFPDSVDDYIQNTYYFELGHAFEALLQDFATGSNLFQDNYFVGDEGKDFSSDARNIMSNIPEWIDKGKELVEKFKRTNTGKKHGSYKLFHYWLEKCLDNPGKQPVSFDDFQMLMTQRDNMLNMKIGHLGRLKAFIKYCKFQTPIFWQDKKALVDMLFDDGNEVIMFDFKTTAYLAKFVNDLIYKYWIQDMHYHEGINQVYDFRCPKSMIFLVASKSEKEKYVCQPFTLMPLKPTGYDYEDRQKGREVYLNLCERYRQWQAAGCKKTGSLELEVIRKYWK